MILGLCVLGRGATAAIGADTGASGDDTMDGPGSAFELGDGAVNVSVGSAGDALVLAAIGAMGAVVTGGLVRLVKVGGLVPVNNIVDPCRQP
jgi:hypothetical protein